MSMASADRSLDAVAFVIEHFRDILRRRISEVSGLALITLTLLGAIALATWSVQDPSLSHATQSPIHNLLGFRGAIFSDLVMQLFGLSAVLLLAPEALLGWRLLSHRPLGEKWRNLVWIIATLFFAAFASCLPRSAHWPLPTGLGGVIGDGLLRVPAFFFGAPLSGTTAFTASLVLGFGAFVALIIAARIPFPQSALEPRKKGRASDPVEDIESNEEDEDRDAGGSVSLGMLTHALLSAKARIMRLIRGRARPLQRSAMAAPKGARLEPRFDGAARQAPSIVGPDFDDEDEEEEQEEEAQRPPRKRASARPAARRSSGGYALPSLGLLSATRASERSTLSSEEIQNNATALESVLGDFGVRGEIINARPGPVVTLYEL